MLWLHVFPSVRPSISTLLVDVKLWKIEPEYESMPVPVTLRLQCNDGVVVLLVAARKLPTSIVFYRNIALNTEQSVGLLLRQVD